MTDIVSPEARSRMMASIRGRNTGPEMIVRRYLHARGFRYRLSPKDLPGKPDVVLPRHRVAVFVHGCFWHGHSGCRFATVPATRTEFWVAKISANKARDSAAENRLRDTGWRVAIVWECALRLDRDRALQRVADFVASDLEVLEVAGLNQGFK